MDFNSFGLTTRIQECLYYQSLCSQKNRVKSILHVSVSYTQLRRHFPETINSVILWIKPSTKCFSVMPPSSKHTPDNLHPVFAKVPCFSFLVFHFYVIRKMNFALLETLLIRPWRHKCSIEECTAVGTEIKSYPLKIMCIDIVVAFLVIMLKLQISENLQESYEKIQVVPFFRI